MGTMAKTATEIAESVKNCKICVLLHHCECQDMLGKHGQSAWAGMLGTLDSYRSNMFSFHLHLRMINFNKNMHEIKYNKILACKKSKIPAMFTGHSTVIVPTIPKLWSMLIIIPIAQVVLNKVEALAVTAAFKK